MAPVGHPEVHGVGPEGRVLERGGDGRVVEEGLFFHHGELESMFRNFFLSSSLILRLNKLDCLTVASFFILIN